MSAIYIFITFRRDTRNLFSLSLPSPFSVRSLNVYLYKILKGLYIKQRVSTYRRMVKGLSISRHRSRGTRATVWYVESIYKFARTERAISGDTFVTSIHVKVILYEC